MEIKNYTKAESLDEAYKLLGESKQNIILGGGLWLKYSNRKIDTMIDLSKLGLDEIKETNQEIIIGSQVTLRALETDQAIISLGGGFLSQAIGLVVGVPFRNLATIGGTIIGKYPFSDIITPLLCLNVKLQFFPDRDITLFDFLESKEKNDAILTHIVIEKEKGQGYFKKVANTMVDFSIINVACYKDKDFKIVIGSRPGKPIFATHAMHIMNEAKTMNNETFSLIKESIKTHITFGDDERGSKAYREVLAITYILRGIKEIIKYES